MPDLVISNTSPHIRITETVGVLLKAKQERHISVVAPLLDKLTHLSFHLSEAVKTSILHLAQE